MGHRFIPKSSSPSSDLRTHTAPHCNYAFDFQCLEVQQPRGDAGSHDLCPSDQEQGKGEHESFVFLDGRQSSVSQHKGGFSPQRKGNWKLDS